MTNGEKYKDTIIKHIKNASESNVNNSYCNFIKSKILLYYGLNCKGLNCHDCTVIQSLWFNEEYKGTEKKVDWANVAVDTPILVRDSDESNWHKKILCKISRWSNFYIQLWRHILVNAHNDRLGTRQACR